MKLLPKNPRDEDLSSRRPGGWCVWSCGGWVAFAVLLGSGGCAAFLPSNSLVGGLVGASRPTEAGSSDPSASSGEVVLVDRTGQPLPGEIEPQPRRELEVAADSQPPADLAAAAIHKPGAVGSGSFPAVAEPANQDATRQLAAQLLREMAEMTGDPAIMEQWVRGRNGSGTTPSAAPIFDGARPPGLVAESSPVAAPHPAATSNSMAEDPPRAVWPPALGGGDAIPNAMRSRPLPTEQQMRIQVVDEPMDDGEDSAAHDGAARQAMIQAMQQVTQQGVGRLAGGGRTSSGSPALTNLLVEQVQSSVANAHVEQALSREESPESSQAMPTFDLRGNRPRGQMQLQEPQHSLQTEGVPFAPRAAERSDSLDWRTDIAQAIATIERTVAQASHPQERESLEVYLRLLRLIASDREAAVRSIEALSPPRQEYWREQIYALSQILHSPEAEQEVGFVNHSRQATKALTHLQKAMQSLRSEATLQLRQVHFCQEIRSFGDYDRARSTIAGPGDPLLIYAEVLNYLAQRISSSAGESFQTSLIPSYSIFNDQQQVVSQKEFAVVRDQCRSLRQDFYLVLQVEVPNLPDGKYHIQVSVEDVEAGKIAVSAPLTFQVRAAR